MIKFDVAAMIPAGAVITSITLTLFCNRVPPGQGAYNINIHRLQADWGEGNSNAGVNNDGSGTAAALNDAAWVSRFHLTNLWNSAGGDYTATASATTAVGNSNAGYSWTSAQAIADAQNWLDDPTSNFGWILIGNEAISTTAKRFASREDPNPAQRPVLSITYTVPPVYTFIGNGNWDNAANWINNSIPPVNLPAGAEIIINPAQEGECILNVPQTILAGGKVTVQANKKFRINGVTLPFCKDGNFLNIDQHCSNLS